MNDERKNVWYYAKLFLLMIIPVYGFIFTFLLAFSKDVDYELKALARGAFIARIVFLIMIGLVGVLLIFKAMPMIDSLVNRFMVNLEILRLFK